MSGIFDTALTYQFIKKLTTPFDQMPAYHAGLIDNKGNFLKPRSKMTSQETNILGLFDVMVINLKKILAKIPGGSSRLGTIAATLFLLRSNPVNEDFSYEDVEFHVTNDFNEIYNRLVEDGVAVNSAGAMPTITPGNGNPAVPASAIKKYKKKNVDSANPILDYVERNKKISENFLSGDSRSQDAATVVTSKKKSPTEIIRVQNKVEEIIPGSQDTIGVQTTKKNKSPSKTEIVYVQNKVAEATSLEYHKELNPKLWDKDGYLKSEIKEKLIQIADTWINFARITPDLVHDIVITGGNVNYNYTAHSDIDLHVVISRYELNADRDFVDEFLQDKKILWTLQHQNISIYGYPVELYAQDINEIPHKNQGVYSIIQNKWLARPQMLDLDFENDYHLQKKVQFYKDMIDKMLVNNVSNEEIDTLKEKIKKLRSDSISKQGEFAFGNLIFKELRNDGYLDKLNDYKKERMDKNLSLR